MLQHVNGVVGPILDWISRLAAQDSRKRSLVALSQLDFLEPGPRLVFYDLDVGVEGVERRLVLDLVSLGHERAFLFNFFHQSDFLCFKKRLIIISN